MTNYRKKIFAALFAGVFLFISGCALPQESMDDEMIEELAGPDDSLTENQEEFGEEFGEFEENEVAAAENEGEEAFDEQGAEDEFAAEEQQSPNQEEPQPQEEMLTDLEELPPQEEVPPQVEQPTSPSNKVMAIHYLASKNGGTVEIKTSLPADYSVRPNASANQYVIEIQNAILPDSLKRPYIMKDFESAIGSINAYQNPGGTTARIVVQMKGPGEPVVSQEGNTLLVLPPDAPQVQMAASSAAPKEGATPPDGDAASYDVKSASKDEKILGARTLDEFLMGGGRFYGTPISIETKDADVRDVISFIGEHSGVNLVISDDVEGKVTLKLRQVPWDQALVIVMRSRGLGYTRQGNVLRITKLSTLQAEAQAAKQIVDSQQTLSPLKVKVMPVSFANVADLEKQVKPFLTTTRGQVVSDARTSSLIITDTADVLMRVERLVKELDIPPAQVMIEGKIVEAGETFSRQVGVNWSLSGSPVTLAENGGVRGTPLRLQSDFGVVSLNPTQLGAQNGSFGLRIGRMDFLGNLNAALSLAQADSLVRIISSPRIVTINKEKAEISQKGETISVTSTVSGETITPMVTRTPVELKLDVTPQITSEGSVMLDVNVLRQFAGGIVDPNSQARPVNSRSAKTKVLVANGQTAVIGGIYQSDETESETGVPVLKDVPVLGWLFKQKSQQKDKNELLIFLTPRILNAKDQGVTN